MKILILSHKDISIPGEHRHETIVQCVKSYPQFERFKSIRWIVGPEDAGAIAEINERKLLSLSHLKTAVNKDVIRQLLVTIEEEFHAELEPSGDELELICMVIPLLTPHEVLGRVTSLCDSAFPGTAVYTFTPSVARHSRIFEIKPRKSGGSRGSHHQLEAEVNH